MGGAHQRKLRNILVNPDFQMKYLLWLIVSSVLISTVISYTFYSRISDIYKYIANQTGMGGALQSFLYEDLDKMMLLLAIGSVIFTAVTAMVGLVFSHRIAGPIYHIQKVLKEVNAGNMEARVRLRTNDELKDLATEINTMLDKVTKPSN